MIARQPWAACASGAQSRNGLLFTRQMKQGSFLRPFSVRAIQRSVDPCLPKRAWDREIVSAEQSAEDDQPVVLESTLWPCLILGNISKQVAESSSQEERTELLLNRCFIVTNRPHIDLWPFDDMLKQHQELS